jgi:hypothetical protein
MELDAGRRRGEVDGEQVDLVVYEAPSTRSRLGRS